MQWQQFTDYRNSVALWLSHWTKASKIQLCFEISCGLLVEIAAEICHLFNLSCLLYVLPRGRRSLFMSYLQGFSSWGHDLSYIQLHTAII